MRVRRFVTLFVLVGLIAAALAASPVGAAAPWAEQIAPISPTPQSVEPRPDGFPLTPVVGLVTGDATDPAAVDEVEAALRLAWVTQIKRVSEGDPDPETPVTIWVGGPSENRASTLALDALGVKGPAGLPAEGYVLAAGRDANDRARLVLAGVDQAGTFYAAQTLRQIIVKHYGRNWLPGVAIRDWPGMSMRGTIEGFYGPPWSHQDRLNQIAFYGAHKLNTYVYAPKDDPYHRERWRDPYPSEKLAEIAELVKLARQKHGGVCVRDLSGSERRLFG